MKLAQKNEVLRLSRNPNGNELHVSGNALLQVYKFRYLAVIFTRDERQNKQIDTGIWKANVLLRELHLSVVATRELTSTAKLL